MEIYTSTSCIVTILCIFATSSAKEICHHDRGSHSNTGFSGQMECSHHLQCCGNVSYKISESSCCNGNITVGLSQLVSDCCDSVAYNPLNEICCNDRILTRSSTHAKCCGTDLYLTTSQLCCGGNKIFQWKENHSCCGKETYDNTTHCCCNPKLEVKPKNQTCCPKATGHNLNLILTNSEKNTECKQVSSPTRTLPKVSDLRCGSESYTPPKQICCSGNLYKKASTLTKCCGKDAYTLSDDSVLCCNGILHRNVPEQSECVGGVIYTPAITTCQMSARPRLGEHCCGGQTFNPRTHICCNGHSHNKMNGNFCCGSEVYDHHNHFLRCCSGHLYNLTDLNGKTECCGNLLLQYDNQTCCSSSTNSIIYDTKPIHRCCGHYYYNTSLWSCCAEHLRPTPKPNSSPEEYRLKPLTDLIPEVCNKTVFFGKVESLALENDQRHVVLKVVWQVSLKSEKIIKDPWLLVSLDHCSSPATDNGMTYLWEENHNGKHKLLSHPVYLTSDIHMFYSVCYQKKG